MKTLKAFSKGSIRTLALTLLVFGLLTLSLSLPSGAQTTSLGTCVADGQGRFPSTTLACQLRIPSGTEPGEYNVVGRCPTAETTSGYPPTTRAGANSHGPLGLSNNRVRAGETVIASGELCQPNSIVTFTLERIGALAALGGLISDSAYAQTGTRTMTARLTVIGEGRAAAAATTDSGRAARGGTLARTGFPVVPLLTVGSAALILGSALVFAGRRRNRRSSQLAG